MTFFVKNILLILTLSASMTLSAQFHPILVYFNAEAKSESVLLTWSISGGNTCSGIRIYHSSDDSSYVQVGQIEGVCGDAAADMAYAFRHKDIALQGRQFYRLELGFQGFSESVMVEFYVTTDDGVHLFPNPGQGTFCLFSTELEDGARADVFDASSTLVHTSEIYPGTKNCITIPNLPSGLYLIRVSDETGFVATKRWVSL